MVDESPITVEEFARRLGISKATVRKWIATRKITYYRYDRRIRIPPGEATRIKEQGTVPAARAG